MAKQLPALNSLSQMIYGVYSGFVHGASTHIFDLVDSAGPYQLGGVRDARDRLGYLHNAVNYPLRAMMAAVVVARSLGEGETADKLLAHADQLQAWLDGEAAQFP